MQSNLKFFSLTFLALGLACKPADQAASSRGQVDGLKGTEYSGNKDTLIEEALGDTKADLNVPVSSTNLTFRVSKDADLKSIDAYIVGYVDQLPITRVSDQEFLIASVPSGSQELIVTGLASSNVEDSLGIRLPIEARESTLDLGILSLPRTGGLQGLAEMDGVAGFSTVKLQFPGTKIPAVQLDSIGRYDSSGIPVGTHKLEWEVKDNPNRIPTAATIESALKSQKSTRDIVHSKPNSPSNLKFQPLMNGIALSWVSGGGSPVGYLVYRGAAQDSFQPVNGRVYTPGPEGAGFIVSTGSQQSSQDSGLTADTTYNYRVFAYNRDYVYSKAQTGAATAIAMNSGYSRYRLYIDSVANDCQGEGTAQIQALNFYIDKKWQINDFTNNSNTGRIGRYPATVAVNNLYNSAYEAYFAFQDDNLPWSSTFKSYSVSSPYNVLSNKNPDGIYFDINFGSEKVAIEGLEMLGGEPPFYPECAPDSYYMTGSNDGVNWVVVPGSAHQENTETRVRYYFQNENRPLSPLRWTLLSNEEQVEMSWQSAAGSEVGYMLVRSRMPEPFQAEQGRSYPLGPTGNGYEILLDGPVMNFRDTSFEAPNTPYYYTLFAYDPNRQYAPSIVARATPEKRAAYRYYRFTVLSILGGGPNSAWVDSLQLQINGAWAVNQEFSGTQGFIGLYKVNISHSSASSGHEAVGLFGPGYWQTAKGSFSNFGFCDATNKTGEYVQLDFGSSPVAITGYRALGNTGYDDANKYLSSMYYQVPDLVRMERSLDGQLWEAVDGSVSSDSFATVVEKVW